MTAGAGADKDPAIRACLDINLMQTRRGSTPNWDCPEEEFPSTLRLRQRDNSNQ